MGEKESNPNKTITLAALAIAILMLSVVVFGSKNKNNTIIDDIALKVNNNEISTPEKSLNADIILFYGITCPHCADVEDWIEQNNVDKKITIERKEVYQNATNARELTKAAESCGLNTSSVGVPFLYAEGSCYVGTPDIVGYISNKIDILEKETSQ